MEYILALIPALAWGSIGIISAKMGGSTEQQTIGSMTGFLFFAIIVSFITKPFISLAMVIVGLISGLLLALGNFGQFDGMTLLGVSTTVPLVASGQLTLNTLFGAAVFKEWTSGKQWVLGTISLLVIILGAKLTSFKENTDDENSDNLKSGLTAIAIAIFCGGMYAIVPKAYQYFMHIDGGPDFVFGLMLPQAIGGILGAFLIYYVRERKNPLKEYKSPYPWKNILTGLAWSTGSFFMLRASTGPIGLATAFTLSQLNLLVGGIGGIVILGESKTKLEMKYFLSGLFLVLTAAIITSRI